MAPCPRRTRLRIMPIMSNIGSMQNQRAENGAYTVRGDARSAVPPGSLDATLDDAAMND